MRLRRLQRQRIHWVAIVALWFAALAPTLSHALVASVPNPLADICTIVEAAGIAQQGNRPAGEAGHAGGWFDHCPMCLLQAHSPALPSPVQTLVLDDRRAFELPRLFLHAGRTLHAWASAQARAPPALS